MSHRNPQRPNSQLPKSQFLDLEVGDWELEIGQRVYVYALVDRSGRAATIGGRRIEIIQAGGVFAAIERDPGTRQPELSEAALRSQHAVVTALARRFTALLPARFGAWIEADDLERALHSNRRRIRRALAQVSDREQLTVRVLGHREEMPADLSSGAAYLRSRVAASRPPLSPAVRSLRRAVKPLVKAERIDPGRGGVRLTIHHLVDRGRAREYRAAARKGIARVPDEQIVISGPWPPFAFAPDLLS